MFGLFGLCLIAFDGHSNLIINTPGWASKDQHYFAFFLHILQHSISRNPLSASEHTSGHTSVTLPWPLQWSHGRPLTSPWPDQAFLSPPLHISFLIFPLAQLGIPDALLCPNVTLPPSHILARPFVPEHQCNLPSHISKSSSQHVFSATPIHDPNTESCNFIHTNVFSLDYLSVTQILYPMFTIVPLCTKKKTSIRTRILSTYFIAKTEMSREPLAYLRCWFLQTMQTHARVSQGQTLQL